ncbi:hypothetical protein VKT23_006885 [Stygiomarasmius scandens]|uniref:GPI anchored protein n=1 Tax=Marasmiellus scandens TaxID=2682957 RepID=A0ABR1JL43_9AGAR
MFSTLVTVALFAAASIRGVAADPFQINTPQSVKQCEPVDLSWSGGVAPFNIIAVPSADPCADALQDLGDIDQWTKKWTPKLPAGSTVVLSLLDTTGEETWSGEITVEAGDDSCVPADLLASASSVAAAASSSAAAASSIVSSSVAVTGTTLTIAPSSTRAAASTSSSAAVGPVGAVGSEPFQSSSNGASHTTAPVMLLGAFAAIAAFIL